MAELDIVTLIRQYTKLEKVGKNFKGLCPFCGEAKFFVYPEQQSWHCFGICNTGGDIESFKHKELAHAEIDSLHEIFGVRTGTIWDELTKRGHSIKPFQDILFDLGLQKELKKFNKICKREFLDTPSYSRHIKGKASPELIEEVSADINKSLNILGWDDNTVKYMRRLFLVRLLIFYIEEKL